MTCCSERLNELAAKVGVGGSMDTIRFATSAISARIGVWLTSAISCSIRRSPARVVRMDRADSAGMASVPGLQQRHHLADVNLADVNLADAAATPPRRREPRRRWRGPRQLRTRAKSVCAPFRSCFLTSAHQRRWRRVRNRLVEPAVPGLMSLTGALPVTVPLVSHSSIPPVGWLASRPVARRELAVAS
jgi:hypothetical protein